MNKNFKPAELNIWVGGNISEDIWGDSYQIERQIFVSCMKEPKTIAQIADEICVAPVYFEDKIKKLAERKFLKVTQDGKYLTDFIIYPQQAVSDFWYALADLYSDIKAPVTEKLYELKGKIWPEFDFGYVLWILYVYAAGQMGSIMQEKNKSKWAGKVAENNGKKYRIAAGVTFPGDIIERGGEYKAANWSNRHCGFNTPTHGKVMTANLYDSEPFPSSMIDGRNTWITEKNINLLMKIFDNAEYKPDEYEREFAANFISQNILKNKDGKLYLNIPVIKNSDKEKIDAVLSELLKDIVEEYAERAAEICDRLLLPLTREDMLEEYANWIMGNAFSPICSLFYKNEHLQIPEDYNASAAGMCLYID